MKKKRNHSLHISELVEKHGLSIRAKNVCLSNRLLYIEDIIDYLRDNKTFLNLKNSGTKTNNELYSLVREYIDPEENIEFPKEKKKYNLRSKGYTLPYKKVPDNISLSDPDYFLKKYIHYHLLFINERIAKILNDRIAKVNVIDFLNFFEDFDISSIKGIGSGKATDFNLLIAHIRNIVNKAIENPNYLKSINFLPDVVSFVLYGQYQSADFLNNYYNPKTNQFYLFKLISDLLNTKFFGDNKDLIIFKNRSRVLNRDEKKPMRKIAEEFELTGERIRQLYQTIENNVWNKIELLVFIIGFNNITLEDYFESHNGLNELDVKKINRIENNNLSDDFIHRVAVIAASSRYFPLELRKKSKNKVYFIDNKYTDINFEGFIQELQQLKASSKEYRFAVKLPELIAKYNRGHHLNIKEVAEIFKAIAANSFDAVFDNENMILERNYRYMYEYALEILDEEGTPLKLEQLYKKIQTRYPNVVKSISSLRGNLQGCEKIIYFGRSSTYGLKKWEEEGKYKGGTIKNIVMEFLSERTAPAHISEIAEYVNKFRKTTEFNILGNLKFDSQGKFIFFNSGFVGLATKSYHPRDEKIPRINLNMFRRSFNRMFDGNVSFLKFDEFVVDLAKKNKVKEIQIEAIIKTKIKQNKLKLNADGYLEKVTE